MKVAWFIFAMLWFWTWPVIGHTEPETLITRFHLYELGTSIEEVDLREFQRQPDEEIEGLVDYTMPYLMVFNKKSIRTNLSLGFYRGQLQSIALWCTDLQDDLGGLETVTQMVGEWRAFLFIRPYDKSLVVEDEFLWDDYLGYILLHDARGTEQALVWEDYEVGLYICTAELIAVVEAAEESSD